MREHLDDDQCLKNVREAKRVMAMVPHVDLSGVADLLEAGEFERALVALDGITLPNPAGLIPAPQVIIKAEILNAIRYREIPLVC